MLNKKMDEYVTRVENDAYELGISVGRSQERERILGLLENFQTQFGTESCWDAIYSEGFDECLALIKGENE